MASTTVLDLLPPGSIWMASLALTWAQGAILLAVGFMLAAVLRQAVAATRHLLWSLALGGVLALPLLSAAIPWRLDVLPEATGAALAADGAAAAASGASFLLPSERDRADAADAREARSAEPAPAVVPAVEMDAAASALADDAPLPARRSLLGALLVVWLVVAAGLLARLGLGAAAMRRIARRAAPASESEWGWAMQRIVDRDADGIPVRLLRSAEVAMPLTSGVLRPTIVLPAAADEWTPERRSAVLRHELAHVRRHDVLTHLLSQAACALHWPNPFVWEAARRMRAESERACDDLVLATGTRASEYAEHLLSIVRAAGAGRAPAPALPFAQRSDFEGRLLRILEPNVRRHGLTRGSAALVTIALAVTAIPLAAMGPRRAPTAPLSIGTLGVGVDAVDVMDDAMPQDPVAPTPTPTPSPQPEPNIRLRDLDRISRDGVRQGLRHRVEGALVGPQPDPRPQPRPMPMSGGLSDVRASDAAIAGLVSALRDSVVEVRRAAVGALGSLEDPRAVAALIQALRSDTDTEVRRMAAWALGQLEARSAVEALTGALRQDRDAEVRKMSAWALGQIEDDAAVEALGAALKDQSAEVRSTSVWALGQIEAASSVAFLVPLLRDGDAETRKQTAWALGQIESREAVGPLSAVLRDDNVEVRETAIWALGEIEDPSAATAIAGALKDARPEVRAKAAWALGQLDELRTAPPALIEALRDSDRRVRTSAAHALGEIEDPAAVGALREAARGEDAELRKTAVWALVQLDDPAAFDALVEMLRDDDPEVRRMAAQALGRNH
jgi:HEAT repeat protein/beta-lactamase regulating signal transducer with metallopeptidase domain